MHESLEEVAERIQALLAEQHIELLRDGEPVMGPDETRVCLQLATLIIGPDAETVIVEPELPSRPRTETDTVELTPELLHLLRKVSGV